MNYLQWYRDQGRGQEAYDWLAKHRLYRRRVVSTTSNGWPVAQFYFRDNAEYHKMWKLLYNKFLVNCVGVYPSTKAKV